MIVHIRLFMGIIKMICMSRISFIAEALTSLLPLLVETITVHHEPSMDNAKMHARLSVKRGIYSNITEPYVGRKYLLLIFF
jgi:hypothetical protein